jgi:hypothetical protein
MITAFLAAAADAKLEDCPLEEALPMSGGGQTVGAPEH